MSPDEILVELQQELDKFTAADDEKIQLLCEQLVLLGVYPSMSIAGYDAVTMAKGYGANWHVWQEPLVCRHCDSDLRNREAGPPFKLELAITQNDQTAGFMCPYCKKVIAMRAGVNLSDGQFMG